VLLRLPPFLTLTLTRIPALAAVPKLLLAPLPAQVLTLVQAPVLAWATMSVLEQMFAESPMPPVPSTPENLSVLAPA
jgi:hypothetical protein